MKTWKQLLSVLLCLTLIIGYLPIKAKAAEEDTMTFEDSQVTASVNVQYDQTSARQMLALVNDFRAENPGYFDEDNTTVLYTQNQSPLVYDYNLELVAMRRALETAIYWDHTRPDGTKSSTAFSDFGVAYQACGENIAAGQTTAQEAFISWKEEGEPYIDQGHRRNMLGAKYDFNAIGIGHVIYNGTHYWTQELAILSSDSIDSVDPGSRDYSQEESVTVATDGVTVLNSELIQSAFEIGMAEMPATPDILVTAVTSEAWPQTSSFTTLIHPTIWETSDAAVAYVDAGLIHPVSSGTAVLTTTYGGKTFSANVSVYEGGPVNPQTEEGFTAETDQSYFRVAPGESVQLNVNAVSNVGPIGYAWYERSVSDGVDTPLNETNSFYVTPAINERHTYVCIVSNAYGETREVTFDVGVETNLSASAVGGDVRIIHPGDGLTLQVEASSLLPDNITYNWQIEDYSIGTTNPVDIANIQQEGTIVCEVSDGNNTTFVYFYVVFESASVNTLTLNVPYTATTTQAFEKAWFSFVPDYSADYSYNITGSSHLELLVLGEGNTKLHNYGDYGELSNYIYLEAGKTYFFVVTTQEPCELQAQMNSTAGDIHVYSDSEYYYLMPGSSVELHVQVDSLLPYTCEWYLNNELITGVEGEYCTATQVGTYRFVATDNQGNSTETSIYVSLDSSYNLYVNVTCDNTYLQPGEQTTLYAAAEASGMNVSYQWYRNGSILDGETNDSLIVSMAGDYYCAVFDDYGNAANSNSVSVQVENGFVLNQTETSFKVEAHGSALLETNVTAIEGVITYQWDKWNDEVDGPGVWETLTDKNDSSLLVEDITTRDRYRCLANDIYGNSAEILFEVTVDTGFTAEIVGGTFHLVESGSSLTLQVNATTNQPDGLTYVWQEYTEGYTYLELSSYTDTLTIDNITSRKLYMCTVSDGINDQYFDINILVRPEESTVGKLSLDEWRNEWLSEGEVRWFTFVPETTCVYFFQYTCSMAIFDEDGVYVSPDSVLQKDKVYQIAFFSFYPDQNDNTDICVSKNLAINLDRDDTPDYQTIMAGESAVLKVLVNSNIPDLVYTWTRNGELIDGVNSNSLVATKSGYYEFTASFGEELSESISFQVDVITDQPLEFTYPSGTIFDVRPGDAVRLEINVSGAEPESLSYRWCSIEQLVSESGVVTQGVDIPGETSRILDIDNVERTGHYQLFVEDEFGNNYSSNQFDVWIENNFSISCPDQYLVGLGETAELRVEGSADEGPITYQWYEKHIDTYEDDWGNSWTEAKLVRIDDADKASLTVEDVQGEYAYLVFATDIYQNCTWKEITVNVDSGLQADAAGEPRVLVNSGDSVTFEVQASTNIGTLTYNWERFTRENGWNTLDFYLDQGWTDFDLDGSSLSISNITEQINVRCRVSDGYQTKDIYCTALLFPDPASLQVMDLNQTYCDMVSMPGGYVWYAYTPEEEGDYQFSSALNNSGYDIAYPAELVLFDNQFNQITKDSPSVVTGEAIIHFHLLAGETYYLAVGCADDREYFDFIIPVSVKKDLIKSIEIEPLTIYEGQTVSMTVSSDGQEIPYEGYDVTPQYLTILLTNGETVEGSLEFVLNSMQNYGYPYEYGLNSDQSPDNLWDVGQHSATFIYSGKEWSYDVMVDASPIAELRFSEPTKEILEYTNGFWDYDEYGGRQFRYYTPTPEMTVVLQSGEVFTGGIDTIAYHLAEAMNIPESDVYASWRVAVDRPGESWNVNETHEITVLLLGKKATYYIHISENPIQSIQASDVTYIEHMNGGVSTEFDETGNEISYYRYDLWNNRPETFTIVLKNGDTYEGSYYDVLNALQAQFGDLISDDYYTSPDPQSAQNPWTVGNTYNVMYGCFGVEGTYNVTIQDNPVLSVSVDPISVPEGTDGSYSDYGDGTIRFRYNATPDTISVTLKDGRTFAGKVYEVSSQIQETLGVYPEPQSFPGGNDADAWSWEVGNTYQAYFFFMGIQTLYDVTITPSLVNSFSIENLRIVEHTRGHWKEDNDFRYDIYPNIISVEMTDGTVLAGSLRQVLSDIQDKYGVSVAISCDSDLSHANQWEIGFHQADAYFGGKHITYKVEIISAEEEEPVSIGNGKCGVDLYWNLDVEGVLTITGSGAMYDYESYDYSPATSHPWAGSAVKQLVLPEGLTRIGANAFIDCNQLTSVQMPSTLQEIRDDAFVNCSSLESIFFTGESIRIDRGCFFNDVLTCYYPESCADSWNSYIAELDRYFAEHGSNRLSGDLTWVSYSEHIHHWGSWTVVIEATCTEAGEEQRICEDDESHKETRIIAPLGHTEEILPAVAATYTRHGLTEGKRCSVCGEILEEQESTPFLEGWNKENNCWFYYESGKFVTGWKKISNEWYYFADDGTMVTGWQKISNVWYYFKAGGQMATGWVKIDNDYYFFESEGQMATGWKKVGNYWYYLKVGGKMATGWTKIDGEYYFFEAGGQMATGWKKTGNYWYYLKAGGTMATGWQKIDAEWYYFDSEGRMITGWQKIDGQWYYLKSGGQMATGWQKIDSQWYYFKSGGQMQTGWLQSGNSWYYFLAGGQMATGWQKINNQWYYFKDSGEMVTGSYIINGTSYNFNASGVWQR